MSQTIPPVERPQHVPAEALFDFNIYDSTLSEDPHRLLLEKLRDAPAVFWTPHNGGHWMTSRYDESFEVLHTPEIFSSDLTTEAEREAFESMLPEDFGRLPILMPVVADDPIHMKYRIPLQESFSPKSIQQLKGDIEGLTHELLDAVIDKGSCDFIEAVGEQLPVRIFLRMMGLPDDRIPEFRELVREIFSTSTADPSFAFFRMRRIGDVMIDIIKARRDEPKQDLISRLWQLQIDGRPITLEEIEDYACLLFIAGLDTVVNAIGFGVRHLALNPDLQETLRQSPELIADATEEMLRYYTMVMPIRRVVKETELGGWSIKPGDRMITYLPMADLDARKFKDPTEFWIERDNKEHMAFGKGPHHCLGVHLARTELKTLYRIMLERMPQFRLDPDSPPTIHVGQMLAISALPLRWD